MFRPQQAIFRAAILPFSGYYCHKIKTTEKNKRLPATKRNIIKKYKLRVINLHLIHFSNIIIDNIVF
jgi:hypothetical protein